MIKNLFLMCALLTATSAFAETIYTQGGGDLLYQVFKTISKILYGEGNSGLEKTFSALLKISLTIGGFCALLLAFFRERFEPLIRNFLLPGLVIVGLLLVPKVSVEIEDQETGKKGKAVEIPFFLGEFASWTTYSFHHLHNLFKNALGETYPWAANLYAGNNFLGTRSAPLSDPDLEENFREFCRECVFRDLGLGLYTKKDLFQKGDLLEFLATNTSMKRAVDYDGKPIPCKEAAELIKKAIASHVVKPSGKVDLLLSGQQKNLAEQKMAIDFLQQEIFSPDLKAGKKESLGALGAIVLMSLRSFFEAVLYLIFPLIVLLSLLSFGIRTGLLWIRSVIWVCTWPIFYLASDLFLSAVWNFRKGDALLNLENAARLSDLYGSMEIIACATLASIPFLSWLLIKGGVSQLVHLSSSLPSQEKIEKSAEAVPEQNHPDQNLPQELSRQTHWEVLGRVETNPSEDGFKGTVENARQEERNDSLQNSLSSIRETVKDSSAHISKTVKESSLNVQSETATSPGNQAVPEDWGSSRMPIPSYGSWAIPERESK